MLLPQDLHDEGKKRWLQMLIATHQCFQTSTEAEERR